MKAMDRREFEALAIKALDELPEDFKNRFDNVDIIIENEPDMTLVKKLGLGSKGHLLGAYQGVPLKRRTHYYGMVMPDKITLYKANIEASCKASGEDLYTRIKQTIQHEIAHHFGISDKRLRDLDIY